MFVPRISFLGFFLLEPRGAVRLALGVAFLRAARFKALRSSVDSMLVVLAMGSLFCVFPKFYYKAGMAGLLVPAWENMIWLITAASILLMLWRPRGIPEVFWVGSGALLLIVLGLIPVRLAGRAVAEGTDVYLFLIGMMLLSALAREAGVFDWVASAAIRHAHGSSARLFTLVYGIGAVVTVFMSNDATAVVLTPAILSVVKKAETAPLPQLFTCALIANAASFVLPISNPANLVVFRQGMPPLPAWLASFGLPSVASVLATYAALRLLFRKSLACGFDGDPVRAALPAEGKLVLGGLLLVAATLLTASAFGLNLGLPTCVAALAVTAAVSFKERMNPLKLAKEISWSTLALVAALFILLDAAEQAGALRFTGSALHWAQMLPIGAGVMLTGFAVGVANNLVNNLPLGLLAGSTLHAADAHGPLAHAVLIGVDLGPNLSITGSLATILWLVALRKEDVRVSFLDFLKVGAVAMPAALAAALGASLLLP